MATGYVATTGNDTTGDGSSGNPYATPGKASGVFTTAGDIIYVKGGTYTLTTATINIAGGPVKVAAGVGIEGYASTIQDLGTPPVISAGAITSISVVDLGNSGFGASYAGCWAVNINVDGNSGASVKGFADASTWGGKAHRCQAVNCTTGFDVRHAILCRSEGCTTGFLLTTNGDPALALHCMAKGGTTGYNVSIDSCLVRCVVDSPSGNGVTTSYGSVVDGCTIYGCGSAGITYSYQMVSVTNCIIVNSGTYAIACGNTDKIPLVASNAFYNNTSGTYQYAPHRAVGDVTLTGSPFTNAAGGDFSLNTTAGGGAACRAAGFPGVFLGGSTTGYLDIGAVQHADPAPSGGPVLDLDDDAANDVLTQLAATFPAGSLIDIYDAAGPADPEDAHTGTLLVSIEAPASPWAAASGGSIAAQNVWDGVATDTGVPVSARLRNAADTKRADFTCTESGGGGQVEIDTATITDGQTVTIDTLTLTA